VLNRFHLALVSLSLLAPPLGATVFQLQPVEKQVREADGIFVGHYLRKKSIRLEDGSLATQMIFKMSRETGLQSDLFGMDEVIVHYPGGTVGDETVRVDGVPEFVSGENVVLMIKSNQDRFWGLNLGFGTFKVVNYGKEKMIINTLFPGDRTVGQMKLEEFERLVKATKGSSLRDVAAPVYPTETSGYRDPASAAPVAGKNRSIASNSDQGENGDGQGMNPLWLVLTLAAMGGLFRLFRQRPAR
jgi:hypothetical protein